LSIIRSVPPAPRRQRPADSRDHPGGDGPGEPVRIADRDHQLANLQRRRITELGRMQVAPVDGDHREIAEGITSDHREPKLPAVRKRRPPVTRRRRHHVRVGDQPVLGDDHGRPTGLPHARTRAEPNAQIRDRR
jgi:hypothetical protein